jgi:RNA polymerase sigma-70 factor (ECF subfamily)
MCLMDEERLVSFLEGEYPRVVAAVGFACGDRTRAEDAVQDVLASLLERDTAVRDARGFVAAAALNRVRSSARRLGAEQRALERLRRLPVPGSEQPNGIGDDVMAALRSLPERQREITALHYLLDMSVADVAGALEVTEGTVKTQLHRARTTLREQLDTQVEMDHDEDGEVGHVRR